MKLLKKFKNKFLLTFTVFLIYALFLDNADIFSIARQKIKLNKLLAEKEIVVEKHKKTRATLESLSNIEAIERFAREEKFFKKENETIFVIAE